MFRSFFQVSCALLITCFVAVRWAPRLAHAEPLPFERTVQLGRPLHPVRVTLTTGPEVVLVSAGKRRVLAAKNATDVTLELVPIAGEAAVAIVRVQADDGPWLGLLGGHAGNELLLFERADPTGDPGEQRTRELAVDAAPGTLRTGVRYEGVSLCADRPAWFDAKRLDATTLTLVPDPLPPTTPKLEEATVAVAASPALHPTLTLLSAVASSELDDSTLLPRVPRTLVDDDPARGLTVSSHGFVQLRWDGGALPVARFELVLHAAAAKPVELVLFDDQGAIHASLPAARGSNRFAITPPRALAGRCLALRVLDGQGVELRELYAYTDLDREGGVDRLIASLVQDQQGGADAADLLEKLGPAAADRLAVRWPELPARGRRRGLKVLARALPLETVRQRVLETAQSDDAELRERAIAVLERGGEPGRVGLRQLALVPGAAGDQAALALAGHAEELPALLAALAAEGGSERVSLRKALVVAERRDPAAARAAATAWLNGTPSLSARAGLALSFANAGDREFTATLADELAKSAQTFEDRYRLALALAAATPSEPGDAWLTAQSEHAEEWMQRSIALSALVQRKASSVPAAAEKAARDAYPRVRANALQPLFAAGQAASVEAALSKDAWPLVRVEAAQVLALRGESRPALELAVSDRSRLVRRAAIDALASGRRSESWPRVRERLAVADESLEVREAAIGFAQKLCLGDARSTLVGVANKALSPEASDEDSQAAVEALRALHDLGGEAAKEGAGVVSKEGGPELKKLWDGLPPARCEHPPQA